MKKCIFSNKLKIVRNQKKNEKNNKVSATLIENQIIIFNLG